MNITIYCGAANGNNDNYQKEAIKLGKWIGKNKHTLIYGGSKVGLMGIIADAVKNEGGKVIGIRPYFLEEEDIKEDLDEMLFVDTMAQRKTKMIELGDYFIALPGGTGTLEEISEVIVASC